MDIVNLMYSYINRFINSIELLEELKKIDRKKYTEIENIIIDKLIADIDNIQNTTPNEIDEREKLWRLAFN